MLVELDSSTFVAKSACANCRVSTSAAVSTCGPTPKSHHCAPHGKTNQVSDALRPQSSMSGKWTKLDLVRLRASSCIDDRPLGRALELALLACPTGKPGHLRTKIIRLRRNTVCRLRRLLGGGKMGESRGTCSLLSARAALASWTASSGSAPDRMRVAGSGRRGPLGRSQYLEVTSGRDYRGRSLAVPLVAAHSGRACRTNALRWIGGPVSHLVSHRGFVPMRVFSLELHTCVLP